MMMMKCFNFYHTKNTKIFLHSQHANDHKQRLVGVDYYLNVNSIVNKRMGS